MKESSRLYENIRKAVNAVRIVDTHEHLVQEKDRVESEVDLLTTFLSHYASSDLVSSGMPIEELEEVRNTCIPLRERWEKLAPFWERIQNTGYARALNIAVRDLYCVDGIGEDTYLKLAKRMEEANKEGLYKWVLQEKAGIDVAILDTSMTTPIEKVDRNLFAPVTRFQDFIIARERSELEALGKRCDVPIHSLPDLIKALETEFYRVSDSIVGVKIGLAYMRTLSFDKVTQGEAEEVFNNIYAQRTFKRIVINGRGRYVPEGLSLEEAKPLQDFLLHKVIQLAAGKGLPIQIHTGLQEGNENVITNSKPTHLINLFREYEEAQFDIFHGSYPYTGELAVLAKNFPNVYIDMCWLHIISPLGARRALSEWLDTVPANKILGFGGDYLFIEGVYGHSVIARENITKVLAEKVEDGEFTEKQAIHLAQRLLRDNAHDLFFSKVK